MTGLTRRTFMLATAGIALTGQSLANGLVGSTNLRPTSSGKKAVEECQVIKEYWHRRFPNTSPTEYLRVALNSSEKLSYVAKTEMAEGNVLEIHGLVISRVEAAFLASLV